MQPLPEVAPPPPGVAEAAHVERLCAPGGLRSALSPAELERFVDGLAGLDGKEIARLLREKLEEATTSTASSSSGASCQAAARACAAVAAVVARGSTAAAGEVAVAFQSDPTPLRSALDNPSSHRGLSKAARRALAALGEEVPADAEEDEAAAVAAGAAEAAAAAASSAAAAAAAARAARAKAATAAASADLL